MSKYVQQISTGIIFVSTPYLEKMAGMRPLQKSEAEALLSKIAPEPADEPEPADKPEPVTQTDEEPAQSDEESAQPEPTDEPEPTEDKTFKELIEAATTKEQIETLVLKHTGKDIDRRKSLETLKAEALA